MEIIQSILTTNPCYKTGKKITVRGLMLHSVGCPQPSAEVFIKNYSSPASKVCVHAFIDANTGVVYQTLPWNHRAWHGGGSSNNTHIGVEMCEPPCIQYTGGASFTCSDREKALIYVKKTYDTAVALFAFLCKEFHLNPLEDGVIVSHKEGHDRNIASGHADPDHLWNGLNCGYTMTGFRQDVAKAMGTPTKEDDSRQTDKLMEVKEGDIVSLASNAVYYNGKDMPDWVRNDHWIVKSRDNDRVVLGANRSGTHMINSPVNVSFLTLVSENTAPQKEAQANTPICQPVQAAASSNKEDMQISERGVELIAKYEGCRLQAYKCPAGVWTIGYGHTAGVKEHDTLPSAEAAKALLRTDLAKYAAHVNQCIQTGKLIFTPTQNQFDALTSFCYNCGAGSLKKLVEGRDAATIADKILAYNKGGGKVLAGLVKRREEERQLFLS